MRNEATKQNFGTFMYFFFVRDQRKAMDRKEGKEGKASDKKTPSAAASRDPEPYDLDFEYADADADAQAQQPFATTHFTTISQ